MASFVGYAFDENDVAVQCYHQAFHYQSGKWSDIRQTGLDGYYSRDTEDTDWDGIGSTLPNGDIILIVAWVGSDTKSGLKDRMCIHKIVSDGSPVYSTDIQLIPKTAPTCSWNIQSEGLLNHNINISNNSSDVYQWTWNSKTFLHDDYYYGQTIFDSVGIVSNEYDYDDGNGYVSNTSVTYTNIGDYSPEHKATNQYGLISICPDNIRIRYNSPSGYFTYSDNTPNLYDVLTINNNINDIDNRVNELRHYFDNSLEYTNSDLNFSYDETLNVVKDYNVKTEIDWNDGFDNHTLNITDIVSIQNINPTVDLSINNSNNLYNFISGADDFEDRLSSVVFKIYISPEYIFEETPGSVTWSLLDTHTINSIDWNTSATFYKGGQFKVTAQATDQDGGISTIDEEIFSVEISSSSTSNNEQTTYFDWE